MDGRLFCSSVLEPGQVPSELGELTALQSLDLSDNNLEGKCVCSWLSSRRVNIIVVGGLLRQLQICRCIQQCLAKHPTKIMCTTDSLSTHTLHRYYRLMLLPFECQKNGVLFNRVRVNGVLFNTSSCYYFSCLFSTTTSVVFLLFVVLVLFLLLLFWCPPVADKNKHLWPFTGGQSEPAFRN